MEDFGRSARVLVVEDDEAIAEVLQRSLRMEGYEVRTTGDGPSALEVAGSYLPDLVVLDLGLPGLDGIDVARELRRRDDTPILMLTARDAVESRVEGLDSGADDYLTKPFDFEELLARLRAIIRRGTRAPLAERLEIGPLRLDTRAREVTAKEGPPLRLTTREY